MPKFETSQYSKIWDSQEGRLVIDTILQDPNLIKANHTFWRSKFRVDPQTTPLNNEGEAVFKSKMREMEQGNLMDMRAPLADSTPMDFKGQSAYTASIPNFIAKGYVEKATERLYKEKMFDQFADLKNIAMFATDVLQRQLDSANQTLSYMSAYLLSRGELSYTQGEGIQDDLYKAYVPSRNFVKAGTKIWSAPDCKILTQMLAKQDAFKDAWGIDIPFIWEIEKDQFKQQFLKNAQVIEWVRYINVVNNTPLPETFIPTEDIVMKALAQYPDLAPIVLVQEKQNDVINGTVSGWKQGIAVFRPSGFAGLIRHTDAQDEEIFTKFGNNVNTYNFTRALDGIATICNSVVVNGNLKEWHTDFWMSAIPSLDEFLYHGIVDTTVADS